MHIGANVVIPVSVDGHTLKVEIADTPLVRTHGLMYRRHLNHNAGMLFIYDTPSRLCFWMKNTLIPLSIAFIADNGDIVHIEDMDPHTTTPHRSPTVVRYALEVNRGWFSERGIGNNSVAQFNYPNTGHLVDSKTDLRPMP